MATATESGGQVEHPLCLIGDFGTGKSHLLIGLGMDAASYRVRYTLASKLVSELAAAAEDKQLSRTINRYGRVGLLFLDELGHLGARPPRRRATVPGPHRTRGAVGDRDRLQRAVLQSAYVRGNKLQGGT